MKEFNNNRCDVTIGIKIPKSLTKIGKMRTNRMSAANKNAIFKNDVVYFSPVTLTDITVGKTYIFVIGNQTLLANVAGSKINNNLHLSYLNCSYAPEYLKINKIEAAYLVNRVDRKRN